MPFAKLTDTEQKALHVYESSRLGHDRNELVAAAALRDIEQIDAAAVFVLSAPTLRALPPTDYAVAEAAFAVPRADAHARLADARLASGRAADTIRDLRSYLFGNRDG